MTDFYRLLNDIDIDAPDTEEKRDKITKLIFTPCDLFSFLIDMIDCPKKWKTRTMINNIQIEIKGAQNKNEQRKMQAIIQTALRTRLNQPERIANNQATMKIIKGELF